jgi:ketosteroid isomerase-like protein
MSPDPNVTVPAELVQELSTSFFTGDRARAFGLLHPDFRIQQPESLPHGGWYRGSAGMEEMGKIFAQYWDRTIVDPRISSCGDASAIQVTTQTWTAKDTGRQATVDVVELFTIADGLVAEIRVFQQDTHLLLGTLDS